MAYDSEANRPRAIRLEKIVRDGVVADQSELARWAHVTQPRMTQIMHLSLLAPDIQEALLCLPRVQRGKDPVTERNLRPVVAELDWGKQRKLIVPFELLCQNGPNEHQRPRACTDWPMEIQ